MERCVCAVKCSLQPSSCLGVPGVKMLIGVLINYSNWTLLREIFHWCRWHWASVYPPVTVPSPHWPVGNVTREKPCGQHPVLLSLLPSVLIFHFLWLPAILLSLASNMFLESWTGRRSTQRQTGIFSLWFHMPFAWLCLEGIRSLLHW